MSRGLSVRFNETEWANLEMRAQEQHMSKSEYVRRRVLADVNPQKVCSDKVIRNLSEVQLMIDALKRKHRNMNFEAIEEKLEDTIYELCEEN